MRWNVRVRKHVNGRCENEEEKSEEDPEAEENDVQGVAVGMTLLGELEDSPEANGHSNYATGIKKAVLHLQWTLTKVD